ncbi:MAG: hypothetical protein ACI8X5_000763 [Planctomycetota bacterium]|jgi:hypothetical protein
MSNNHLAAALGTAVVSMMLASAAVAGVMQEPESVDFERDVRPILEESCFRCHGPHARRIRGHLMMADHDSLVTGGDSGSAVVPGDPDRSLLIRMVRYESEDFEMPPNGQLDLEDVEMLERWVEQGASWPASGVEIDHEVFSDTREISIEEGRNWWAFRPVERPAVPQLANSINDRITRNAIDQFVNVKLEQAGLDAGPVAEERFLVRRLYLDLVGVQPSFEEIEAYLLDSRKDKWGRLVDELLARPQYGERWGRYWLDIVRFAQTNGYEKDAEKLFIWRYRDYVYDAYNRDLPFDDFLREQLAGDEIEEVTQESLTATGFYSLGLWDTEPNDAEQAVWDMHDDTLRTITEGMMGVTVGCARCHDHRFDPVRQKDYYSFIALLRNVRPYSKPEFSFTSKTHRLSEVNDTIEASWKKDRDDGHEELEKEIADVYDGYLERYIEENFDDLLANNPVEEGVRDEDQTVVEYGDQLGIHSDYVRKSLTSQERLDFFVMEKRLQKLEDSYKGEWPWIMCVSETGAQPTPTNILRRGKASAPLDLVRAGFLPVLCADDAGAVPEVFPNEREEAPDQSSSGQRLALANWIASPAHPTTARVMVNRIWQGHFGQGLVATPNDFGATGEAPSHPLLLDWLADEFVKSGWSMKYMHRLILNSATYRRSSAFDSTEALAVDPGNRLLWRQNMRRLDAESLHDSILAVCGSLNPETGGRGYFPALSLEAMAGSSRAGSGWELSSEDQRSRRAAYAYVKRGMLVPLFTVFDSPDPNTPQGKRSETTVANQALTLLNGEFTNRVALELARELLAGEEAEEEESLPSLVSSIYRRIMLREPTVAELEIATSFIANQKDGFEARSARLTFRPAVPKRVEISYFNTLSAENCLHGPREAWEYRKGAWGNEYNMTQEALPDLGPLGLLREPVFQNGLVTFDLTLEKDCEAFSLYLRASGSGEQIAWNQVIFDIANEEVRLLRLNSESSRAIEVLRVPYRLSFEECHQVALQIFGPSLRVSLDGEVCLEYRGSDTGKRLLPRAGRFGVGVVGGAAHLEYLQIQQQATVTKVSADDPGTPLENAIALFCLTALNLNEFLYVD